MPAPTVSIRPVAPGDAGLITDLFNGLDPESRYRRWFTGASNVPGAVAWAMNPAESGGVNLIAVADGRAVGHAVLVPAGADSAELAFEVAAPWRRHGIAGNLLERLVDTAAAQGLHDVYAEVLAENADMLAVMREHGEHTESVDGPVVRVTLPVQAG